MLALLKFLPELVSLVLAIVKFAQANAQEQTGIDEVVKQILQKAQDDLAKAAQATAQATADHATKKDDTAFDQTFQRDKP